MTETSHKTPRKSTNRRHDKWIAKAEENGLYVIHTVAICSMWNAGYQEETIAEKLGITFQGVSHVIHVCRDSLRAR